MYRLFSKAVITEEGSPQVLVPRSGPWLQGLQNLGYSCYLNSVAQLLFHLPESAQRYAGAGAPVVVPATATATNTTRRVMTRRTTATTTLRTTKIPLRWWSVPDRRFSMPCHPHKHRIMSWSKLVQTAKLATALVSGIYSQPTDKDDDDHQHQQDVRLLLAPRMFKQVIGTNHVDFSTGQQQDAAQFLQYFLEQSNRAEQAHKAHFMTTQTASSSSTTSTNTSVPTSTFFIHPPICCLLPPKRAPSVPPIARSNTIPKRKQRNDVNPFGVCPFLWNWPPPPSSSSSQIIFRDARGWCCCCYQHYYDDYYRQGKTRPKEAQEYYGV
ncbi:hypothetical protein ACA910_015346 [Epithemia clementina (nom. ined.)]